MLFRFEAPEGLIVEIEASSEDAAWAELDNRLVCGEIDNEHPAWPEDFELLP